MLGAAPRSERMVSAVASAFLRPMWRRDASTARRSNSSSSKTLRRSIAGGVGRGVKCGFVADGEGLVMLANLGDHVYMSSLQWLAPVRIGEMWR